LPAPRPRESFSGLGLAWLKGGKGRTLREEKRGRLWSREGNGKISQVSTGMKKKGRKIGG